MSISPSYSTRPASDYFVPVGRSSIATSKAPTGRHYDSPGHRPGSYTPMKSGALKGRNIGGAP